MIRDLSQTLQALLTQPGLPPDLAAAQVVFDRPTAQFNPQQSAINLFLYDIRENLELRNSEYELDRLDTQAIQRPAALRVACTYLVTAWAVGGAEVVLQEHRLLSQVLQVFARYGVIPEAFCQGSLREQKPSVPLVVTAIDGLKNPAEFWSALGTPLRASLTVSATISLETIAPLTFPLTTSHKISLDGDSFQIGGKITNAANEPVLNAAIAIPERNLTTTTNGEGRYRLGAIPPGSYTLRIQPPNAPSRNVAITVPGIRNDSYNIRL
jgi:Pvc16 N-terminal domain/Carboxypeptidase regulatory-like domain